MGTGVGEAMLIGAVTGAGTSAVTGGDPLKGALFGAVGGGATAGLGGALGGSSGAATGATSGATSGAGAGITGASTIAPGAAGNVGMTTGGFGNTIGTIGSPTTTGTLGSFGNVGSGGLGNAALPSATGTAGAGAPAAIPTGTAAGAPTSFDLRNLPSTGDILSRKDEIRTAGSALGNFLNKYPIGAPAAAGAFTSALGAGPKRLEEEKYRGPLSRFRYSPDTYIPAFAEGGIADLPVSNLGSYSDGGRLLKGPGDGMSDSIPAKIGRKQPARLADGEFVVPADVVSGLGNGSTDAGAKQLYAMMDKVRRARTGTKKQGKEINPRKYVPA